VMARLR